MRRSVGWRTQVWKWNLIPALALAIGLTLAISGDTAHAQVSCEGFGFRQMGFAVYGSPGGDLIDCAGSTADLVIFGMDGNDVIVSGSGRDILMGGAGFDFLFSREGNDFLSGGEDSDFLFSSLGDDYLAGGAANDLLVGGPGSDVLHGGPGDDILIGGSGMDVCDGQEGEEDIASTDCEAPINIKFY